MTDYKATPEQWADIEKWNSTFGGFYSCVLELRARVEALEKDATEDSASTHFVFDAIIKRLEALETSSKPTPNSSQIGRSLVNRVALAISGIEYGLEQDEEAVNWASEARAAIREVAAWMTSNPHIYFPPALVFAIEQEVDQ